MTTVNQDEVVALISDLVRIESVTPWLVPSGSGEGAVAAYLRAWLAPLPVEVEVTEVAAGRFNVLATLRGLGGGPSLCLNAHADTVGFAGWPNEALEPVRDGERLYGLGAADDKGCCAIALLVLRHFATRAHRLRGDLVVACVADEEGQSIGTQHLVATSQFDLAIVLEADALPRVVVEHQGFGWIDIVLHGRAAHGSTPEAGVDAIMALGDVLGRLRAWDVAHGATPDARNGRVVFHTGTVRGGTDYATYPSEAVLGIEIGTQPGETLADRVTEIETILAHVRAATPGLTTEVLVRLDRDPFRASGHEALLAALQRAARTQRSAPLDEVGMNAWTDAALMQAAGTPTVLLGPLGGNLHAPGEWVSIPEVLETVDLLVDALGELLG